MKTGRIICAIIVIAIIISLIAVIKKYNDKSSDVIEGTDKTPAITVDKKTDFLMAKAEYPEMAQYPDGKLQFTDNEAFKKAYEEWVNSRNSIPDPPEGYDDGIAGYLQRTTKSFLMGETKNNVIYSPACLFMAMAVSAEITDGRSREQILKLLGENGIKELRENSKALWEKNYQDDGMTKEIIGSSLWLNSSKAYEKDTIGYIAKNYYSSVYSGDPGSADYEKCMQEWMNEHTDGLLKEYISNIRMNPEMLLSIVSAVSFSGKWKNSFLKENTKEGVFHAYAKDITCDFMNCENNNYFRGDGFSSLSLNMEGNCKMITILPDESISCDDLIKSDEILDFVMGKMEYPEHSVKAYVSIPKFDISSDMDLCEGLKSLGITDIFDASLSDFSPLTKEENIILSKAEQAARVMIDEEGCRASALTHMLIVGDYENDDEPFYYTLDRPFIFSIVGESCLPLFIGIVNNPGV